MARLSLRLDAENASVILRRAGETRTNYLSHTDVEEMVARGWRVEIIHDGGEAAKAAIMSDLRRRMRAS